MKHTFFKESGVTALVLAVTIVVILLLVGLVVTNIVGENGLISETYETINSYEEYKQGEEEKIEELASGIKKSNEKIQVLLTQSTAEWTNNDVTANVEVRNKPDDYYVYMKIGENSSWKNVEEIVVKASEYTGPQKILACIAKERNPSEVKPERQVSITISNIDTESPTNTAPQVLLKTETSYKTIVAELKQSDSISGLNERETKYAIRKKGTSIWGNWQATGTFDNLEDGTTYEIKTKATDKAGNVQESEVSEIRTKARIELATIGAIANQTYSGQALTPEPTVTYNGTTLTKDTDYNLTYTNNINAGTAVVTITGKGEYVSEQTKTFTINKKAPSLSINRTNIITNVNNIERIVVTYDGDGEIVATSRNTGVATVRKQGNEIIIVGKTIGDTVVDVSTTEGTNYLASMDMAGYYQEGLANSTKQCNLSLTYDIDWLSGNLLYGLHDIGNTAAGNMSYSINNKVITATGNNADGWGYTTGRVYLEAGKTYIFNCTTNGSWPSQTEAFLMLNGTLSTWYHMASNYNYTFTPTVTGTYWLRVDANGVGATYTFSNISIHEKIKTETKKYNESFSTSSNITRSNYNLIGWSKSDYITGKLSDNGEYYGSKPGSETGWLNIKQYTIQGPFYSGDRYKVDADIKGTGVLTNYFYGGSGYLTVANWNSSDGKSGTNPDGDNRTSLTNEYRHYSVTFTLGESGNGSIAKHVLFRVFPGNTAYVKNVRVFKLNSTDTAYCNNEIISNLTTSSGNVKLYSIWQDAVAPTISANNIRYGSTLSATLTDNQTGVTGYQINQNSENPIQGWTNISSKSSITITRSGLSVGTWYIWAKDETGNVSKKTISVTN